MQFVMLDMLSQHPTVDLTFYMHCNNMGSMMGIPLSDSFKPMSMDPCLAIIVAINALVLWSVHMYTVHVLQKYAESIITAYLMVSNRAFINSHVEHWPSIVCHDVM